MAKFASVSPDFWTDGMVAAWADAPKMLALYLLTCPHRNLQGLYRLSVRYAADDLGWSEKKTKAALTKLVEDGFAEYDWKAKVVLLPKALRYYQPKTKPQLAGALQALARVPDTSLKSRFTELAREHGADALLDALVNGLPEPESSDE